MLNNRSQCNTIEITILDIYDIIKNELYRSTKIKIRYIIT